MYFVVQQRHPPTASKKRGKLLSTPILHIFDTLKDECLCGIKPNDIRLTRIEISQAVSTLERCYTCKQWVPIYDIPNNIKDKL